MKKIPLIIILAALAAPIFAQIIDKPVASIRLERPELITLSQLEIKIALIESQTQQKLKTEDRKAILKALIGERLILQAAESEGINVPENEINARLDQIRVSAGQPVSDEAFILLLESQLGISFYLFREEIKNELVRQRYILETRRDLFESISQPTEEQVSDAYHMNLQQFVQPEMVRLSHIFFSSENQELAEKVQREIVNGISNFDESVYQFTEDASSKMRNGDIGYLLINDTANTQLLGKLFLKAVFDLDIETISPVLISNAGLHIVKITDRQETRILKLDDRISPLSDVTVRQAIVSSLLNQLQIAIYQDAYVDVVNELKEKAEIQVFEGNIS